MNLFVICIEQLEHLAFSYMLEINCDSEYYTLQGQYGTPSYYLLYEYYIFTFGFYMNIPLSVVNCFSRNNNKKTRSAESFASEAEHIYIYVYTLFMNDPSTGSHFLCQNRVFRTSSSLGKKRTSLHHARAQV